jgi:hypothetical protein
MPSPAIPSKLGKSAGEGLDVKCTSSYGASGSWPCPKETVAWLDVCRANDGNRNSSGAVGSSCMQDTCGTRAKNFNLTINRLK